MRVAARGKHFYVLWPHRCSAKWFQPSLKSDWPTCPYQVQGCEKDTGKDLESRLVSSEGVYTTSHCHTASSREYNPEGGAVKEATPTLQPRGKGLGLSKP